MKVVISLLPLLGLVGCAQRGHVHSDGIPDDWEAWAYRIEERVQALEAASGHDHPHTHPTLEPTGNPLSDETVRQMGHNIRDLGVRLSALESPHFLRGGSLLDWVQYTSACLELLSMSIAIAIAANHPPETCATPS